MANTRRALITLPNAVGLYTSSVDGKFHCGDDSLTLSHRHTPFKDRLIAELVHPQVVIVLADGSIRELDSFGDYSEQGLASNQGEEIEVLAVARFSFGFDRNGNLKGEISARRHLQSTRFEGHTCQNLTRGEQAISASRFAVLEAIERFGIEFLKSIEDPRTQAEAALRLLNTRDELIGTEMHFGHDAIGPDLDPEALTRSGAFVKFAVS